MKLSRNKISKLLNVKKQSNKKHKKKKAHHNQRKSFRKKRPFNIRNKSIKGNRQRGGQESTSNVNPNLLTPEFTSLIGEKAALGKKAEKQAAEQAAEKQAAASSATDPIANSATSTPAKIVIVCSFLCSFR